MSAAVVHARTGERSQSVEQTPKILLVDDLDANLMALTGLLRDEGIELVNARSGRDALELLLVEEFALAIVDVQMPEMNGFELAELMRGTERTRYIPIIFITAGAHNQQHRFRGYEVGAVDFLFKPIEPDVLRSKASVFLDLHRVKQQVIQQRNELAHREHELAAELEASRLLQELSTRLIQADDPDSLYKEILHAAVTIMDADFATVQMLEKGHAKQELRLLCHRGFSPEAELCWSTVTVQSGTPCGAALRTGRRQVVPDIQNCAGIVGAHEQDVFARMGIRAVHSTPLYSRSGELIGMLSTHWRAVHQPGQRELNLFDVIARQAADLIERTKLESAIFRAQKMESIGVLAGGIAHDFNNILVGVLGGASLAMDTLPPNHDLQPTLHGIASAAERAAHLTRQMLAYAGKGSFVIEPVSIGEVIQRTCDLVNASIPKHVRVTVEWSEQLPAVEGDRSQIEQIVMNLLLNAAESIDDERSGEVTIRTHLVDLGPDPCRVLEFAAGGLEAGRYVVLEVQDNGSGMDSATKARVFEPFFTTKFTGRGLGLAAVSGILRGHRGALQVESAVGEGSTFRVFLPAAGGQAVFRESYSGKARSCGTGIVLVVDDEEIVRRTAASALQQFGYSVRTVDGGEEAIRMLSNGGAPQISAIVLDMSMPGVSGKQVMHQIRDLGIRVPVLICSGYSEAQVCREFSDLDIAGCLLKPFTARQLAERVASVLKTD